MLLPLLLACSSPAPPAVAAVATPTPPATPAPPPSPPPPPPEGTLLLDAGHGAPGNVGNTNWRCEAEQDVMKRVTDGVTDALVTRGVTVRRTRPTAAQVPYPKRLEMSADADWLVSLHSDSRAGDSLHADPRTGCWRSTGATGVAVLWSDEGEADLVKRRHAFARAVATRIVEAGFEAYDGADYPGLYDGDEVPGVFVDRHTPKQRIMLLRRPKVPSVIIETHQAWDPGEAALWDEPATWDRLAGAIAGAVGEVGAGG